MGSYGVRKISNFITGSMLDCFYHDSDYLFKMLLIGNSGVGKSCLLVRYAVSIPHNESIEIKHK